MQLLEPTNKISIVRKLSDIWNDCIGKATLELRLTTKQPQQCLKDPERMLAKKQKEVFHQHIAIYKRAVKIDHDGSLYGTGR